MRFTNSKFEIGNWKFLFYSLLFTFFLAACSKGPGESDDIPAPPPSKAKFEPPAKIAEPPRYAYRGGNKDPMAPLGVKAGTLAQVESLKPGLRLGTLDQPELATLALRGVIHDATKRMALIEGGGKVFVLRGGRLYDERGKPVPGIAGVIRDKGVIVFTDSDRVTLNFSTQGGKKEAPNP